MPVASEEFFAQMKVERPKIIRRGKMFYKRLAREIESCYTPLCHVAINIETGEYIAQDECVSGPVGFAATEKWGEEARVWIQRVEGDINAVR